MQVVYRLWEGSWEDGAVLRDRERRLFADPARIHRIHHEGRYYRVDAIHLCEPSPQRTPVLYQAGASRSGRAFAAAHAECVFINGPSREVVAPQVADIRRRAAAFGRDLLIFTLMTVITGRSEAEARAKHQEMVLLRLTGLVVDFFAHQHQHPPAIAFMIALQPIDPDVVIGDADAIEPGIQGRLGDRGVIPLPVGVGGVHVKVTGKLGEGHGGAIASKW